MRGAPALGAGGVLVGVAVQDAAGRLGFRRRRGRFVERVQLVVRFQFPLGRGPAARDSAEFRRLTACGALRRWEPAVF
ncbi:hypothetical protein ACZ91_06305 [Streptomyces regensis]|nr:hypothetical protein ACZ91_06305 [Streptomyces regensis]